MAGCAVVVNRARESAPDGAQFRIAFSATPDTDLNRQIYLIGLDGTGLVQLTKFDPDRER